MKKRYLFTFPPELVQEPIIWQLGRTFAVVTNIRRADVEETHGWVVLELEGSAEEIERAVAWAQARGVRVDPVVGDVLAG
jgi:ABC-type methionine transport system ATPase subunit